MYAFFKEINHHDTKRRRLNDGEKLKLPKLLSFDDMAATAGNGDCAPTKKATDEDKKYYEFNIGR